ncbi:hypothetical protein H310_06766 [Aphanomyces invadans]|uniref:Ubiquitin-like protease family profile domain-containing protein n=1 Tax=Aphanomyces invadans TaxID=157072 RepID=A0A024U413_9STRA|nr:hypothetical protein H310_06766 [Aphanomyces invadans]ETW01166.1 hypothetical protein H310_06766 [Aphanomyces invadans]|eukprot:XP_008870164.1 hypothetical protein H310_06766 [Aphanomyces invadans]
METSLREVDEWRMERRIHQAVASSEEAIKCLQLVSDKPLWLIKQQTMSRRDFWNQLHSALPSEYKAERARIRSNRVAAPSNDPFGVQTVKRSNAELLKQLAQQMKHLSQRKKGFLNNRNGITGNPNNGGFSCNAKPGSSDNTSSGSTDRKSSRFADTDLESYHAKWRETSSQIHDIEAQLEKLRVTRQSGDIERQHDAWVANRQWELVLEDVVREELGEIMDELLEESDAGRELPEEDDSVVETALHGGPPTEVLCQKFNVDVSRGLLQCLLPATWLNDEIVNFWFQMLTERDATRPVKSHFFNSFFFSKVSEDGYNYTNVRRWTRKVDLFAMDKIFVPVNIRNVHWCLAVIFMKEKRIQYYDSMAGVGIQCLDVLFKYLHDESQHKKNTVFDSTGWELVATTNDTPQQGNSFDCGVFTCMFADFLSRDLPLTFSQRDMKFYRRRMVLRMVQGSIPEDEGFDL